MTNRASIRFYAELNDFLPAGQRQRDIDYEFSVSPSVKDVIEALGVPHTEVDVVLVDGQVVDFSYRIANGDRISVYPVFETFDIASVTRLWPAPLRDVRFVADVHLGTLARYLRLLGFDTLYGTDWADKVLADLSVHEHRILLTRDRGLLKRRQVTHGLFIRDDDPRQQVVDIVRRLHLVDHIAPFTRCMACNGILEPVDKVAIADRLESETRRHFNEFYRCAECTRIYWQGSHHARLTALIEHVRAFGEAEA